MGKIFQPKIIIGSVCGVIGSVVGFIAIFFPSLFNLETKKIEEYSSSLETQQDAINLYNFLKKNQNRIVKLDLLYKERSIYQLKLVKNSSGEEELRERDLLVGSDGRESGEGAIGLVDKEGIFCVVSKYKREPFCQNFFRSVGGIGVWVSGKTASWEDDLALQIIIPKDSNGNKLYQWGFNKDSTYDESGAEMRLVGMFFVNIFIDSKEYSGELSNCMSPEWSDKNISPSGDNVNDTQIVELEPLSKKELETKNY